MILHYLAALFYSPKLLLYILIKNSHTIKSKETRTVKILGVKKGVGIDLDL